MRSFSSPPPSIPMPNHADAASSARHVARHLDQDRGVRRTVPTTDIAASSAACSAVAARVRSSHHDSGWNHHRQRFRCAANATGTSRRWICAASCASAARSVSTGHRSPRHGEQNRLPGTVRLLPARRRGAIRECRSRPHPVGKAGSHATASPFRRSGHLCRSPPPNENRTIIAAATAP